MSDHDPQRTMEAIAEVVHVLLAAVGRDFVKCIELRTPSGGWFLEIVSRPHRDG